MASNATKGRRPDIEQELNETYHVGWKYVAGVNTSEFDIEKSQANQARFEAIDEAVVAQYVEGVERGDPFPAVIAYRPRARSKLVIIDGNHRLAAHAAAQAPISVYEIEQGTRAQVIAVMTFAFNTKHGKPTSEDERVEQALYLINSGASIDEASAQVNVPSRLVKRAIAKSKGDVRADEVGLDRRKWDMISQSGKNRLLNISTDEGFKDAAELAYAASLDATEIFELVGLLNSSRSATKHRQIIKTQADIHRDRIQLGGGGVIGSTAVRKGMTPRGRVSMALGQINAWPNDLKALARTYADGERTDQASMLMQASDKLKQLALALDPKIT